MSKKDIHRNFNSAWGGGGLVVLQRQGNSSVSIASSVATLGLDLQTDRSLTTWAAAAGAYHPFHQKGIRKNFLFFFDFSVKRI